MLIYQTTKSKTARQAAKEFAKNFFTDDPRKIRWHGDTFQLVGGSAFYEVKHNPPNWEIHRIKRI